MRPVASVNRRMARVSPRTSGSQHNTDASRTPAVTNNHGVQSKKSPPPASDVDAATRISGACPRGVGGRRASTQ